MNRRTFLLSCLTACCYQFLKLAGVQQDKQSPKNIQTKTPGRLRLEEFWAEDR